jgi:thioredoxin 1
MLHSFTDESFQSEVLDSSLPVLVDFFANWCGPCQMMSPVLEELSTKYEGKIKIGKIDVDENSDSALRYGVMGIPAFKFFKGGVLVDEMSGANPPALEEKIKKIIGE